MARCVGATDPRSSVAERSERTGRMMTSRSRPHERSPAVDLEPFDHIVDAHADRVWRVCRALVGRDDVDDVWSETFLAALRAYPDLTDTRNVAGWLVTIAHNKAMDHHRRAARRPRPIDPDDRAIRDRTTEDRTSEVDTRLDGGLVPFLAALTERQRTAVLLHHIAGLPYADVAITISSSEAAARRAAADGIARLRQLVPQEARP